MAEKFKYKNMINIHNYKLFFRKKITFEVQKLFTLCCTILGVWFSCSVEAQITNNPTVLNNKGKEVFNVNIDSAVYYFNRAFQLAEESHNDSLAYKSAVNAAIAYSNQKKYISSISFFNKALEYLKLINKNEKSRFFADFAAVYFRLDSLEKANNLLTKSIYFANNDSTLLTNNYLQMAIAAYENGNCAYAMKYYRLCNNFMPRTLSATERIDILFNTGLCYQSISSYSTALVYFNKALSLSEKKNYTKGKISVLNNIAQILAETGQMKIALRYIENAKDICRNNNDLEGEAALVANTGKIYLNQQFYNKAIVHLEEAYKMFNSLDNSKKDKEVVTLNLGEAYYKTKQLNKALLYFDTVLSDNNISDSTINQANAFYYKAEIYTANGNFKAAIANYNKSLAIAKKNNAKKLISGIYFALSKVFELQGDMRTANNFLKQYIKLNNEIFSEKLSADLAALQAEYDLYKKETEIKQLKTTSELQAVKMKTLKQRNLSLIAGGLLLTVFLIVVTILYWLRNKAYRQLVQKNVKIVEQEDVIKQRIDFSLPHAAENIEIEHIETDNLIERMKKMLEKEKLYIQQGLTSSEVAEKLGTNRTYLSQAINKELDLTFNQLINEYRVKDAIRLLSDKKQQMSIEGIARSVGFSSKSSFNPAFKKFTGVTPSFFRENVLNSVAGNE